MVTKNCIENICRIFMPSFKVYLVFFQPFLGLDQLVEAAAFLFDEYAWIAVLDEPEAPPLFEDEIPEPTDESAG